MIRLVIAGLLLLSAASAIEPRAGMPRFRWEHFTTENGLPDDHVFNVCVDGNKVWAATENGVALFENGKWKSYGTKDGLAHRAVLFIAPDRRTGDVWIATMGGLSRFSAGRFDNFTQLNSGLPNDVVYGVAVQGDFVWTATAAGAGRLNTRTGQWSLFNERNTPMYEIWTYAVSAGAEKTYYAVWGGGVLEFDAKTEQWKNYDDPDAETEMVVLKDQGLVHEITTSVSWVEKEKILWVATYFGSSRYDGRNWKNFLEKDSGLPSNFTNQVKAVDGKRAWFATDKGLAYYDGENWAVYKHDGDSGPVHDYVLSVDFQGDDIWVATAKGLSHGIRIR